MKKAVRFLFAAALSLLAASPALAQWQTPNHSVPIGKGSGVQGFGNAAPGTAGRPFISNGAAADPSFGTIANSGFASGAANTVKGSLDGVNVTDLPLPSCTAVSSAWRYASGVGINCGPITLQTGYDMPVNFGLSSSAAAGALTLTVTQANGSAPTAGAPALTPFRSTAAGTGTVVWGTTSATTSIVVPSGATLGVANGVPFRIWVYMNYNSGTPALGVAVCSSATTIFPCATWEGSLKTTVTIDTAADNSGVLYATSGVVSDAVRIVGYCEYASGLVTAGAWAGPCTTLQPFGPGVPKPGQVVQTIAVTSTTAATRSNAAFGQLAPAFTQAITLGSPVNLVKFSLVSTLATNGSNIAGFQLARGSTLIGVPRSILGTASVTNTANVSMSALDQPQASSATYGFQGKDLDTMSMPPASTGITYILDEIQG